METLGIEPCENGLRLTIYNNDNTQTEISWHCCLDGPKSNKTLLNNALRTCIDPQIWDYRCRHFPSLCQFCDEEATEVDHVYEFHKIRDEFLNTYQGRIPEHFTKSQEHSEPPFYKMNQSMHYFKSITVRLQPISLYAVGAIKVKN